MSAPDRPDAADAALDLARQLGLRAGRGEVLHDRSNLLLHVIPDGVVARVVTRTGQARAGDAWLRREVAIASHLVRAGAPVVPPATAVAPGPHTHQGHTITFWEYLELLPGRADPAAAGHCLRACHEALDDFSGGLPAMAALQEARGILRDLARGGMVPAEAIAIAEAAADRVDDRLGQLGPPLRPVHGDAHLNNALHTAGGPLWGDWEDCFLGPREWDLACLVKTQRVLGDGDGSSEAALAAYGARGDPALLDLMIEARTVQVTAWSALLWRSDPSETGWQRYAEWLSRR